MMLRDPSTTMRQKRTPAQYLHGELCTYVRQGSNGNKLTRLKKVFSQTLLQTKGHALAEASANGHTHLIDAIHLPFTTMCSGNSEQTALDLLSIFHDLATPINLENYHAVFRALLFHPDKNGHTPFHRLAIDGNVAVFKSFLDLLEKAINASIIWEDEIATTLKKMTLNEFKNTPLHLIMIHKRNAMCEQLASFVIKHLRENAKNTWETLLDIENGRNQTASEISFKIASNSLLLFNPEVEKIAPAKANNTTANVITALVQQPTIKKKKKRCNRGGAKNNAPSVATTDTANTSCYNYISNGIYGLFSGTVNVMRRTPILHVIPETVDYMMGYT